VGEKEWYLRSFDLNPAFDVTPNRFITAIITDYDSENLFKKI
jgi:methylthioribose-1-phosphate isomerase